MGGAAQVRGIFDDGKMNVVLPQDVALPPKGVAGWKFDVLMRNPRGLSLRGMASCRLALQRDQNTRDCRRLILEALGRQYPWSLRRLSMMMMKSDQSDQKDQNDRSCGQCWCGR